MSTGLNSISNVMNVSPLVLKLTAHTEEEKRLICVFTKVLKNVSQLDVTAEQCPQ